MRAFLLHKRTLTQNKTKKKTTKQKEKKQTNPSKPTSGTVVDVYSPSYVEAKERGLLGSRTDGH